MRVSPLLWVLASYVVLRPAPLAIGSDATPDGRTFNLTMEPFQRELLVPREIRVSALHATSTDSQLAENDDHLPVPHNYPPPPDLDRLTPTPLSRPGLTQEISSASQDFILAHDFAALGDNNTYIPPDTQGAVGPTHLMTTLNSQVRIQSRSGSTISTFTLSSFFLSAYPSLTDVYDPRLVYDPYGGRWVFVSVAQGHTANSVVLVAVSDTSDPTQNWTIYEFPADLNGTTWADYPLVGFNKNWIAITANMFSVGGNSFAKASIYVLKKAQVYSQSNADLFQFDEPGLAGFMPVTTYDASLSDLFVIQDWNGNTQGKGLLRLWRLTGSISNMSLQSVGYPTVLGTWDFSPPSSVDFAPQAGTSTKIQANDSGISSACYRNGLIWAAHTIFLPAGGNPSRSAVQYWKIASTGSASEVVRFDDSTAATFFAFPSIAVNRTNGFVIGFSLFSPDSYAGAGFQYRSATDPASTSLHVLKSGQAPYVNVDSKLRNRWGDLSETVVDPQDDSTLWTIQEYAAPPSGRSGQWGTWWGGIMPTSATGGLPDLTPYTPSGWSSSAIVTTKRGGTTDSDPIYPTDQVSVSWAVANLGGMPTSVPFAISLTLDGVSIPAGQVGSPLNPAESQIGFTVLGTLEPGVHSVALIVDSNGQIHEGNENNNSTSRTFTVRELPCDPAHDPRCGVRITVPEPRPPRG
jgi:hypothetical protein